MRKILFFILFLILGLLLIFGVQIAYTVKEKYDFIDQSLAKDEVPVGNKSTIAKQILNLKEPDNSIAFFEDLKEKSEAYWETIELNESIYGFQTQPGTLWNKGLTEDEIAAFEAELDVEFPEALKNFYRVMNGVNLPAINIYADSGETPSYSNNFYSYPDNIEQIKKRVQWVYEANNVTIEKLQKEGIARIFPVFGHRFLLLDEENGIILSMHGDDIIYWTDNLSKLLAIEIFKRNELPINFKETKSNVDVKFWLD